MSWNFELLARLLDGDDLHLPLLPHDQDPVHHSRSVGVRILFVVPDKKVKTMNGLNFRDGEVLQKRKRMEDITVS